VGWLDGGKTVNSEFIQPFIDASIKVIGEVTARAVTRGPVSIKTSPVPVLGVASVIGIVGEIEGRLVLDVSRETSCRLASCMNGQELTAYDSLVTSTINELANMIGGLAVSALVNKGYKLEITPPTLFSGNDMKISNITLETVVIPLELDLGRIILNIGIRAKTGGNRAFTVKL
jgi:chemotaxis protein CheX